MRRSVRIFVLILALVATTVTLLKAVPTFGAYGAGIDEDAEAALKKLYASEPVAKMFAENAKAILVFPNIIKGGFLIAAQYGEGVLFEKGQVMGHYNTVAGSFGFQAGGQAFGYAMFLMTDKAVQYLNTTAGFEVGVGPSLVVFKKGMGKNLTTSTIKDDIYAFIFNQRGLMGGAGIQGSKITKIR